jgi:hypothetical protein
VVGGLYHWNVFGCFCVHHVALGIGIELGGNYEVGRCI